MADKTAFEILDQAFTEAIATNPENFHSAEFNAGLPSIGHNGRIIVDVAPETEKIVASVWVLYRKRPADYDDLVRNANECREKYGWEPHLPAKEAK